MTNTNLRDQLLRALQQTAVGNIEQARMNVEVYLLNPVGIGEHPDIMETLDTMRMHQVVKISSILL